MSDAAPRATEGIQAATTAVAQECVDKPVSTAWPYTPHVIIFFSSACIMVVELVAGRLIARHLGSSLYTWTSIIGVVLAGMSIGNFIGGRMADRWRPERSLGWLFLVASCSCVLSLGLNSVVGELQQGWKVLFPLRVVFSTLFIFLFPALVLGTISPVTAKMALDRSRTVGSTIGSVYAWGAVGSIVGTFATGFFLIAALGAKGVVLLIAAGLGLIGLFLGPWRIIHAIWVAVVLFFLWLSQTSSAAAFQIACRYGLQEGEKSNTWLDQEQRWEPSWEKGYFTRDGDYQYVRVYDQSVYDESIGRPRQIRALQLDYLIHGYLDLQDPSYLKYAYEKTYAEIAKLFVGNRKEVSALFLGPWRIVHAIWVAVVLFFLWLSQTNSAAFQIACRYGLQEGEKRNSWLDQ